MRRFLAIAAALSDPGRARALMALRRGELCVCDLIALLGLAPSTVSKHMTLLWEAGLVERRKQGRWHYYRLPDGGRDPVVAGALDWARAALEREPQVRADVKLVRDVCCRGPAAAGARGGRS